MNQLQTKGCVVITGSSKGIGFGLAQAFLQKNYCVVLSGRDPNQLNSAYHQLLKQFDASKIHCIQCDVTQKTDLENLWHQAIQKFNNIEIWINNAGGSTATLDFKDISNFDIENTVKTNILGTMLGSQVALQGMIKQNFGQIFNMEGWGSKGEWSSGMTVYATTKYAVSYFSKALVKEAKSSPICVGTLSPGMVATDLLIASWKNGNVQNWKKMKRLFFFIIDPPEIVCQYLVRKIIQNQRKHARIVWMTPWRLFLRFFQPSYWKRNPVKDTDLEHLGH